MRGLSDTSGVPATQVPCVMFCREGSKRLPGKNRLDWLGKPLWRHVADVALSAPSVVSLCIGSDMPDVAIDVLKSHGKMVSKLTIGDVPQIIDAVDLWRKYSGDDRPALLVQVTSPLINVEDLETLIAAAFADGDPIEVWALGSENNYHPKLQARGIHGCPSGMGYIVPAGVVDTIATRIVNQRAPMVDVDTAEDFERAKGYA